MRRFRATVLIGGSLSPGTVDLPETFPEFLEDSVLRIKLMQFPEQRPEKERMNLIRVLILKLKRTEAGSIQSL